MAAPASSRKAKAPPAPAPQPPGRLGIWLERLEKLGKLGALGTSLGAAVAGLGFVTLRARETLLGSPEMSYPYQEWLFTGFNALGSLFWRGVSVLVSDHPVLRGSAWALLLLLLGLVLAARSKGRPALLLWILGASALLLVVGSSFYRIALAATAAPNVGPSRLFHCGRGLSANLADRVAFETCSWLVNDTPVNDGRRNDLGGLLGWLLAVCLTAAVAGVRARSRRLSRLQWSLAGAHALLGLLLLYDLPRAHAFATWGLRYPQVQINNTCDQSLAQATTQGNCWAFDVSAGAEKKMVFVQGSGCPEGRNGSFVPMKNGECLLTLSSPPRVIAHE